MISKTRVFIFLVVCWFGISFARAAEVAELEVQAPAATVIEEAKTVVTDETQIPVHLETRKAEANNDSPLAKMAMGLIVVLGLGTGAWILVRKYRFANRGASAATEMKLLTQFHLGPKKSLAVVRVAGESILIGVTDHHISLIKSLSLLDEDVSSEAPAHFAGLLQNEVAPVRSAPSEAVEGEEFAISGIRDFVTTRLKNMRNLE